MFISYVREDLAAATRLQDALEAAGITVWRDVPDIRPGVRWRQEIQRAITKKALVFVACFSGKALDRPRSGQRVELTLARQVYEQHPWDQPWLIPVRFDDCDLSRVELSNGDTFEDLSWLDLFGDGWDEASARLIEEVHRLLRVPGGEGSEVPRPEPAPRLDKGRAEPHPPGDLGALDCPPERDPVESRDEEPSPVPEPPFVQRVTPPWSATAHRVVAGASLACGIVGFLFYRGVGFGAYLRLDDLVFDLLPRVDPTTTPVAAAIGVTAGLATYLAALVEELAVRRWGGARTAGDRSGEV